MIAGEQKRACKRRKTACRLILWRRVWDSNPREIALKLISNQPRYDHFDNPPCVFRPSKTSKQTLQNEEKRWRENGYLIVLEPTKNPYKSRVFEVGTSKYRRGFRVRPVMTTSIRFRIFAADASATTNYFTLYPAGCQVLFRFSPPFARRFFSEKRPPRPRGQIFFIFFITLLD